jgi:hypothetical protein
LLPVEQPERPDAKPIPFFEGEVLDPVDPMPISTVTLAPPKVQEPGNAVTPTVSGSTLGDLELRLSAIDDWDSERLLTEHSVSFDDELGFVPSEALGFDLLQSSSLALSATEQRIFDEHGFVISSAARAPSFSYAYHNIYADDLPVLITADSILDTVHRSFEQILKHLELELLAPTLESFLARTRGNLSNAGLEPEVLADADLFLALSQSFLEGAPVAPIASESFAPTVLKELYDQAMAASGIAEVSLFGVKRHVDFTQFEPRGHYTLSEELGRYFRAMMWLGRIDLRLLETNELGERILHRHQVELSLALGELLDEEATREWSLIDDVVTAFVGEHDYLTVEGLDALKADLGITGRARLADISDADLAQAIVDGNYGEQRIASHVMMTSGQVMPLPLNASFALFGQRYVVDSHVFSEVVYDRVPKRVVPNPLDVAFAALGNDHAALLLGDELRSPDFAGNLAAMRVLVDAHPAGSWESSLYTLWLGALRELSAGESPAGTDLADSAAPNAAEGGLPGIARSEAWGRRLLNTQLGSWAQLRHDTILYAKPSYTTSSVCEFPDAYVDPYPAFWSALLAYAEHGKALLTQLELDDSMVVARASGYFDRLASVVTVLQRMSEHQLTGMPHSDADVAFVNDAVRISGGGSGAPSIEGWYHQLLFEPETFREVDNTVADVHTDPGGDAPLRAPSVLHVGHDYPRTLIAAIETCEGPRLYAGPVFAYKELLAAGLVRYTDEEWLQLLHSETRPDDVPWMKPIVAAE